jgi:hypothetical protein
MDDFADIDLSGLNKLHEEMIDIQRVVIICTICIVAAILVVFPPLIYIYFRKAEKGIWLLNEKSDNLLEYYKTISDEKKVKSLV